MKWLILLLLPAVVGAQVPHATKKARPVESVAPPGASPAFDSPMSRAGVGVAMATLERGLDTFLSYPNPWICKESGEVVNVRALAAARARELLKDKAAAERYRTLESRSDPGDVRLKALMEAHDLPEIDRLASRYRFSADGEKLLRVAMLMAWDRGEFATVSFYIDGWRVDHPETFTTCPTEIYGKRRYLQALVAYSRSGRVEEAREIYNVMRRCDKAWAGESLLEAGKFPMDDTLVRWPEREATPEADSLRRAVTYAGNLERFVALVGHSEGRSPCSWYDWKFGLVDTLTTPGLRYQTPILLQMIKRNRAGGHALVPPMVRILEQENAPRLKETAAEVLEALGPTALPALPALTKVLREAAPAPDGHIQDVEVEFLHAVVHAYGSVEPDRAVMVRRLLETGEKIRRLETTVVVTIAVSGPATAPFLLNALDDPSKEIRSMAFKSLKAMKDDLDDKTFEALFHRLEASPRGHEQNSEILILLRAWKKSTVDELPVLKRILDTGTATERSLAADRLGGLGAKAVPLLASHIASADENLLSSLCYALSEIGEPAGAAVPVLTSKLAELGTDPKATDSRSDILYALGNFGEPAKKTIPLLLEKLKDGGVGSEAVAAGQALGNLGVSPSLLLPLLEQEHNGTRSGVLRALSLLRSDTPAVRDALIAKIKDKNIGTEAMLALVSAKGESLKYVEGLLSSDDEETLKPLRSVLNIRPNALKGAVLKLLAAEKDPQKIARYVAFLERAKLTAEDKKILQTLRLQEKSTADAVKRLLESSVDSWE